MGDKLMIASAKRISDGSSCDEGLLQRLILNEISGKELESLTLHLNRCTVCRNKLDLATRSDRDWQESASSVRKPLSEPFGYHNLEPIVSEPLSSSSNVARHPHSASLISWLKACDVDSMDQGFVGQLDKYLVRRVVGAGGMGVVFEGWDKQLHRPIAIKAMHPHLASIAIAKQRFIREARAAAVVAHPNVVPIHSINDEFDPPYLVMPLIVSESLQARIERNGPLDVGSALRVASQIADGLAAAHSHGLIHRDVKPANILLELGTERALITNFGVVRVLDDAAMTTSGAISGTPEYMSPEQAMGHSVNFQSDLFSLGSVLYAVLSGRSAVRADSAIGVLRRIAEDKPRSLASINPHLPNWLISLVEWLHKKPHTKRPSTSMELADALRNALSHWNSPQHFPAPKFKRRNTYLLTSWLLGGIILLLFCVTLSALIVSQIESFENVWIEE